MHQSQPIYNLFPNLNDAIFISNEYAKKAVNSVRHIALKAARVLGLPEEEIRNRLNHLSNQKLSSTFFVINTKFVRNLTERPDAEALQEILQSFCLAPWSSYIFNDLSVNNVDTFCWSLEFVAETVNDANSIHGSHFAEIKPLNKSDFLVHCSLVYEALSFLKKSQAKNYYDEIVQYVSNIILFDGYGITGGSSTRTMGAIYIGIPSGAHQKNDEIDERSLSLLSPLVYYIEQLVHETSHLHLEQIMELDSIVLNRSEAMYPSPLRKDLRPMKGVYHAAFVLARLYHLYKLLDGFKGNDFKSKERRFHVIKKTLSKGLDILDEHAELTTQGRAILKQMHELYDEAE